MMTNSSAKQIFDDATLRQKFQNWLCSGTEEGNLIRVGSEPDEPEALLKLLNASGSADWILNEIYEKRRGFKGYSLKPSLKAFAIVANVVDKSRLIHDYADAILVSEEDLLQFCSYVDGQEIGWNPKAREVVSNWYAKANVGNLIKPREVDGWGLLRLVDNGIVKPRDSKFAWLINWREGIASLDSPDADSLALAIARAREPMRARLRARLVEHYGISLSELPEQKLRSEKFWSELRTELLGVEDLLGNIEILARLGKSVSLGGDVNNILALTKKWQLTDKPEVKNLLASLIPVGGLYRSGPRVQVILASREDWVLGFVLLMRAKFNVEFRRGGSLGKVETGKGTIDEWANVIDSVEGGFDFKRLGKKLKDKTSQVIVVGGELIGKRKDCSGLTGLVHLTQEIDNNSQVDLTITNGFDNGASFALATWLGNGGKWR